MVSEGNINNMRFFNLERIKKIIVQEYDGTNVKMLAIKYGFSEKTVGRIIRESVENQPAQKLLQGSDTIKIILDDKRAFPHNGAYNCVRTYDECIFFLRNFHTISYISLDYDLGGKETGYDILCYLKESGNEVKHINIHSDHSEGVPKMRKFVEEHFPHTALTFNPL